MCKYMKAHSINDREKKINNKYTLKSVLFISNI